MIKATLETPERKIDLLDKATARIHSFFGSLPRLALVLGSAFSNVEGFARPMAAVSFAEIPGFPPLHIPGHAGKVILCELAATQILLICGRPHLYEVGDIDSVMFPIEVLARCGVRDLVLTNAAGGINPSYKVGEFMLISDHINFTGRNPLEGRAGEKRSCFVDLSDCYSLPLRNCFKRAASRAGITLHEGIYIGVAGPSYETPAEIRAFRTWGADAVGMSTVCEAIMARYHGLNVAGLSCITNAAAGMSLGRLSHDEVLTAGARSAESARELLHNFADEYKSAGREII